MNTKKQGFSTTCVHAGVSPDATHQAIMTPIFQTSTYVQDFPGQAKTYDYGRAGNPTRTALEESLAALEGANHSVTYGSGLAAVQAVAQLLEPGSHVLVCDDVYGGSGRLFRQLFAKYNIEFDFVDMTQTREIIGSYFKDNTKLVWIETPTNPLLKIIDIELLSAITKTKDVTLVVDNTFASPAFQSPLSFGADIVMHSVTKYIGGHSDVVGGCLMMNDPELLEKLKFIQFAGGAVNAPVDCFFLLRSIKTLALRMDRHQENALKIAQAMEKMDGLEEVIYPGLESHPQHELAKKQMNGFSGIISIRVKGGFEAASAFMQKLKLFSLAESLGGVESLANHPETMTHASVPEPLREKLGITGNLVRLSVGIEDAVDLIADIEQALK